MDRAPACLTGVAANHAVQLGGEGYRATERQAAARTIGRHIIGH